MNLIVCILVFIIGIVLLAINGTLFLFSPKLNHAKIMSVYLLATLIEGLSCFTLSFIYPNNNFFITHIFFNVQLFFLAIFYYQLFHDKKLKQYVKIASIFVWIILAFQYILYPASFWQLNLFEIVSISCLLISFGLLYLYNTLGESNYFFYFSLGLVMYFLCSCIIYLFGGLTLVFCKDPYIDHWIIKDLFFILFQLLIMKEYQNLKNKGNV